MNAIKFVCQTIFCLSLISCAKPPPMDGQTSITNGFKNEMAIHTALRAKLFLQQNFYIQCDSVDVVKTYILGSSSSGKSFERWVAILCGKEVPYLFTFTPDGEGGTFFSVKFDRDAYIE